MAGSFGFEREKVDVSLAIANDRLLPAVKHCGDDALVIANGYSCREQIAQTSERRALHLAQVMALGMRPDALPNRAPPEQAFMQRRHRELASSRTRTLATLGALGLGAALWAFSRHHD